MKTELHQMNHPRKRTLRICLAALCCFLWSMTVWGQYDASSSFYTPYFNETLAPGLRPIRATACDVMTYFPRKKNYAIVGMNYAGAPHCGRYATFFVGDGNLAATSADLFSEIHFGITKVLFHPTDPNTFYVLYQEHRQENLGLYPPDDDFRTYLKRFQYNNTPTLLESPRLEIFKYNNGADMAIMATGDIMITGVNDIGRVEMRVVRNMSFLSYAVLGFTTMPLSEDYEARRQYGATVKPLWGVSMDAKGNQVAIAHTKGNGSAYSTTGKSVRLVRFDYQIFGPSSYMLVNDREDEIGQQIMVEDIVTPRSVGMRANGDVVYLWHGSGLSPLKSLAKIKATGPATPTYVFTEAPSALDVVVSTNDDIFVSGVVDGEHAIGLFNGSDAFEHLYDVHSDLDNPTHDIAVDDCSILASGHKDWPGHKKPSHQLFSCDECGGGGPHAEFDFVAPVSTPNTGTFYGLLPMAIYCDIDDMVVDGSLSSCENSYWIAINRMNVGTWTILETLYANWVDLDGEVPNNIQIADLLSPGTVFNPADKYLLTLTVGHTGGVGPLHSEHKLFKIYPNVCGRPAAGGNDHLTEGAMEVTMYPNPSQGWVNVEVANREVLTHYRVTDMLGKLLQEGSFQGQEKLNLTGNPAGMYLLHLNNGQSEITKKIVLE